MFLFVFSGKCVVTVSMETVKGYIESQKTEKHQKEPTGNGSLKDYDAFIPRAFWERPGFSAWNSIIKCDMNRPTKAEDFGRNEGRFFSFLDSMLLLLFIVLVLGSPPRAQGKQFQFLLFLLLLSAVRFGPVY